MEKTDADTPIVDSNKKKKLENTKKNTITPIIVRQKEKWSAISKRMVSRKINYTKAKMVSNGIQVEPFIEDNYRKLYR